MSKTATEPNGKAASDPSYKARHSRRAMKDDDPENFRGRDYGLSTIPSSRESSPSSSPEPQRRRRRNSGRYRRSRDYDRSPSPRRRPRDEDRPLAPDRPWFKDPAIWASAISLASVCAVSFSAKATQRSAKATQRSASATQQVANASNKVATASNKVANASNRSADSSNKVAGASHKVADASYRVANATEESTRATTGSKELELHSSRRSDYPSGAMTRSRSSRDRDGSESQYSRGRKGYYDASPALLEYRPSTKVN